MANASNTGDCSASGSVLEELALAAASGNEACFALLATHFAPFLNRAVSALPVPPEEREDLRQEGLIGLYKAVRLFDASLSSFSTFARICMRSAVLDGYRAWQKTGEAIPLLEEDLVPAAESDSPERLLIGKEELSRVLGRLDLELSPLEKKVFILRLQGMRPAAIAAALGLSLKSVDNASARAKKKVASLSWKK